MVEPVGRGEGLGRPLLYGTTGKFLEHFGFRSLEDLPRPDELPVVLRDRTPVAVLPLDDESAESDGVPSSTDAAPAAATDVVAPDGVPDSDAESDTGLSADDTYGEVDSDSDTGLSADDALDDRESVEDADVADAELDGAARER